MIAAHTPVQRPRDARLLIVDASGRIRHSARDAFVGLLNPHDLAIANDAGTDRTLIANACVVVSLDIA